MSSDQQLTPWPTAGLSPEELPLQVPESSPPVVPNMGHALIFLFLLGVSFVVAWVVMGTVIGLQLFGKLSLTELQKNTYVLIGMMAGVYGMTITLSSGILPRLWQRRLRDGVYWNSESIRTRLLPLIGLGIGTSLAVELLSNYLPIPKSLPIDDFFKTPGSVWTVAAFGIFIAPAFEELVFRGFILPALASAWDWSVSKLRNSAGPSVDKDGQPRWSLPAMIVASLITSIGFATIHSEQLAHSWAPLVVLYCVSLVLCAVRLRMRSLAASALVHASYNFTLFAIIFIATSGFRHLDKIQS
jgi:CAAX protease family protein